ncbi:MAG: serine hydrolase [Solirubrobacterales bacterium]|nr:serine hydrolase [Solirubrobacterales bacterium]
MQALLPAESHRRRSLGLARGSHLVTLGVAALLVVGVGTADAADPAPRTQITEADTGPELILTRKAVAVFRYRAEGPVARFQCILDTPPWKTCRRGFLRRLVDPGRHVFRVRAVGPSGAIDPTPAVRKWEVSRWEPNVAEASRFAAARAGRASFSLDLGWRSWGSDERARARMASTIKVMLMVAYLSKQSVRNRALSGTERSLISAMIRVSDNNAANWVSFQVGTRRMNTLARRAGMRNFSYSPVWGTSTTSALDQAGLMYRIERLLPDRHRGFALGLLSRISAFQRWGVAKARPPGWRLFFKGGWGISDGRYGGTVNHQIALIRRGRYRIGLAILTQGNPYTSYGEGTLKGVARRLLEGLPNP